MSLGSDRASAMTGNENCKIKIYINGLKKLSDSSYINNVHGIAHRLALCTSQAAERLNLLRKQQQILSDLFYYFKGMNPLILAFKQHYFDTQLKLLNQLNV